MSKEKKNAGRPRRKSSIAALIALALIAVAVIISALTNDPAENNTGDGAVILGSYEQDNNTDNGKEAIEWIVLTEKDGKMLVTSRYALDCAAFHDALEVKITWENSSLRAWLNDGFMNEAFTAEEQERIVETEINDGEETTNDKVFLLSADELAEYFAEEGSAEAAATAYAEANGARVSKNNGNTYYWLRAPREIGNHQSIANNRGAVLTKDANGKDAVRPAMWITAE